MQDINTYKVLMSLTDKDGFTISGVTYKALQGAQIIFRVADYPDITFPSQFNPDARPATQLKTTDTFRGRFGPAGYSGYDRPKLSMTAYLPITNDVDTFTNYFAIPVSKGAWDSGTTYAVGDWVTSSNIKYICNTAHTNHTPPNTTYWDVYHEIGSSSVIIMNFYILFNLWMLNHRFYLKDLNANAVSTNTNLGLPINILMNRKDWFGNDILTSDGLPIIITGVSVSAAHMDFTNPAGDTDLLEVKIDMVVD